MANSLAYSRRFATLAVSAAIFASAAASAHAMITPIVLLDQLVEYSQKQALATPGHAEWCAKQRTGYRKEWNNWRNSDGSVTYCASPFYAPPWKMKPAQ
jgi:hypothetical protein